MPPATSIPVSSSTQISSNSNQQKEKTAGELIKEAREKNQTYEQLGEAARNEVNRRGGGGSSGGSKTAGELIQEARSQGQSIEELRQAAINEVNKENQRVEAQRQSEQQNQQVQLIQNLKSAREQNQISQQAYEELTRNIQNQEQIKQAVEETRRQRDNQLAIQNQITSQIQRGQTAADIVGAVRNLPKEYQSPESQAAIANYAGQVQKQNESFKNTYSAYAKSTNLNQSGNVAYENPAFSIQKEEEGLNRVKSFLGIGDGGSNRSNSGNSGDTSSDVPLVLFNSEVGTKENKGDRFIQKTSEKIESLRKTRSEAFDLLSSGDLTFKQSLGASTALVVAEVGRVESRAIRGFSNLFINPIDTTKETILLGADIGESILDGKPVGRVELIIKDVASDPLGGTAELYGGKKSFDIAIAGIKNQPIKTETIEVTTPEGSRTLKVFGIETKGRSAVLGGILDGKFFIGRPRLETPIPFTDIITPIAAPRTATGTSALTQVLATTPEEIQRVAETQSIIRNQRKAKGEQVEELVLNLEEPLKNPQSSAKLIDIARSREGGVIFGSTLFQQLPAGFRRPTGDIDIIFPKRTEQQLFTFTQNLATKLRASGEDVRVSPSNPLIIERPSGSKLLEAKSGVNPSALSGPEVANAGGLGFDFPNLKGGQIGSTVPFGEGRAIRAGEQLTRKGIASTFFRGFDERAPEVFQEAGIFPLGRRTKDLPDFVLQTRGLIEIGKQSVNPFTQAKAFRTESALGDFLGTFKPEQRTFIEESILESQGKPIPFDIIIEPSPSFRSLNKSPSSIFAGSSGFRLSEFESKFSPSLRSPSVSSRSPLLSDMSRILSPSERSPSRSSRSQYGLPSPSPSYYDFPSPSPIESPYDFLSPSPKINSPSSTSIFNESPFSPSPSPKSSPSPSPSPYFDIPEFNPIGSMNLFPSGRNKLGDAQAYDVYVRRGEKRGDRFVKVADDLPRNRALSRGADIVDNYIEASFKVVPQGKSAKQEDDFFAPDLSKFTRPSNNSKLSRDTYVEKRGLRLDTFGEVEQISYFKQNKSKGFDFNFNLGEVF